MPYATMAGMKKQRVSAAGEKILNKYNASDRRNNFTWQTITGLKNQSGRIYRNAQVNTLKSILVQRCHFMVQINISMAS
ncbi:MAG: hypothetical protein PW844_07510 [Pantoea sp.]|uniref:hypothetical protein n=1 Tax=unclassified Pantoea TaxID=2630326 RepID=UPI00239CB844|nr:hypothetical protein [Pantoea sp.]MDE1186308.1 hypothetical protein [Pantoea sp.]